MNQTYMRYPHAQVWTPEKVRSLGMTCDVETAGRILGIGRTVAYRLAKENNFPVTVRRIGGSYRVMVQSLLEYLVPDEQTEAAND